MASNTGAKKRQAIKWIRDKAKAAYEKMPSCYICNSTEDLELHHTHSLTNLFEQWARKNNIDTDSDEAVLEIRDDFIAQHNSQIYDDVFTLCNTHHKKLHAVYGKAPELTTAKKQSVWINKQKDKHNGNITKESMGPSSSETKSSTSSNIKRSWLEYRV